MTLKPAIVACSNRDRWLDEKDDASREQWKRVSDNASEELSSFASPMVLLLLNFSAKIRVPLLLGVDL